MASQLDNKEKELYASHAGHNRLALSAEAKQRVKDRIFQQLAQTPQDSPAPARAVGSSVWGKIARALKNTMVIRNYVVAPLVVLLLVLTTGMASAYTVPGDALYPVKRQIERARVYFAPTVQAKLDLQYQFAEERLWELDQIRTSAQVREDWTVEAGVSGSTEKESGIGQSNASVQGQTHAADNATLGRDNRANKGNSNNTAPSANSGGRSYDERETWARQEAQGALDFLEKAKQQLQDSHDSDAENLNKRIEDYRNRLQDQEEEGDNDSAGLVPQVKGSTDQKGSFKLHGSDSDGSSGDNSGPNLKF